MATILEKLFNIGVWIEKDGWGSDTCQIANTNNHKNYLTNGISGIFEELIVIGKFFRGLSKEIDTSSSKRKNKLVGNLVCITGKPLVFYVLKRRVHPIIVKIIWFNNGLVFENRLSLFHK